MDLAKTENMKFNINNKYIDLTQIVQRSFDHMEFRAKEKNINLILKVDDMLLPFV